MSALILKAANEFSTLVLGTSRSDDSVGDRLSYRYTCAILVAFAIIVSNREFTSKRIQCWVPAFFTGNYEDYANNVCWVRNTYYIEDNNEIPPSSEARHELSIRYYQWIPFILLFQAFLFFTPYILWRVLCQRSGVDIRDIVEAASSYKQSKDDKQSERYMKFIISAIDQYVDDPRRQPENRETLWWKKLVLVLFPTSGRYMGDYLRNLFLFIKIIYIVNLVSQVLLLSLLLGQPFWKLGATVIGLLYHGKGWDFTSRYFPKVTLCDFQIREPNALPIAHTYTVMCVLPINLFNQQIFTFLWFWLVLVFLLTIYDLIIWVNRLFFRQELYLLERLQVMEYETIRKWPFNNSCAQHVIKDDNEILLRLKSRDSTMASVEEAVVLSDGTKIHHQSRMYAVPRQYYEGKGRTVFELFNKEYLEADGLFILRIIGTNVSDFVSTKIVQELYKMCCEKRFRPNEFEVATQPPRTTLYKYLIIPKEGQPPALPALPATTSTQQPATPSASTQPKSNPFETHSQTSRRGDDARPEIKQRRSHISTPSEHEHRARSDTQPFLEQLDELPHISTMRSGNGSVPPRHVQYPSRYGEHSDEPSQ